MSKPLEWTDSHVEKLRQWWPKHTANEIVVLFGAEGVAISRNSVVGKAHRLKLPAKATRRVGEALQPEAKPTSRMVAPPKPISTAPQISPHSFVPRVVDTDPRHLTIVEVKEGECRYECSGGEPADYTFCGHPVQEGFPYCPKHKRLCYLPRPKGLPFVTQDAA